MSKTASVNKNVKKLRALSVVCSLTRSWQQWVSENEDKQASEPSGWAPVYQGETKTDKRDKIKIKTQSVSPPDGADPAGESRIRTAPVVKSVTRDVQERSAGIDFLTKRICTEPSADELDKMLSRKGSPTRRRKCSSISELTRGWKEMEKEKRPVTESAGDPETHRENHTTNENTESTVTIKRSSVLGSSRGLEPPPSAPVASHHSLEKMLQNSKLA